MKKIKIILSGLVLGLGFASLSNSIFKNVEEEFNVQKRNNLKRGIIDEEDIIMIQNDFENNFDNYEYDKNIKETKWLKDFNDNNYLLLEFEDCGYAIYNEDMSKVLELSKESPSPYKDLNEDLYYFGALNHYYKDSILNTDYLISCQNQKKIELNLNNIESLSSYSLELSKQINDSIENESKAVQGRASTYCEEVSVSQPDVLKYADTTDINTEGNCGYVGAALIVYYASIVYGWGYLYDMEKSTLEDLVDEIQDDRENDSLPADVEDALNDFLNSKNHPYNAKVNMWLIPAAHTFYDRVEEDKPVCLFGQLYDELDPNREKCDHVVVVYKVKRDVKKYALGIKTYSNYMYTVHGGWGLDYNEVVIAHDNIMIGGLVNLHK